MADRESANDLMGGFGLYGATSGLTGWDTIDAIFDYIKEAGREILAENRDELERIAGDLIDGADIPGVPPLWERPIKRVAKMKLDWLLDTYVCPDED